MKYNKPPLTYDQQADKLINKRGLIANRQVLIEYLKAVSYYRLSGYWYPFKKTDETFKPGTSLDKIWERYIFDRKLRLFILDAIERIEISIRTLLVYEFTHAYGAFGHLYHKNMPNLTSTEHNNFITKLNLEKSRSKKYL